MFVFWRPAIWLFVAGSVIAQPALGGEVKDYVAPEDVAAALSSGVPLDVPLGQGQWLGDTYVLPYTYGSTYDRLAGGQLNLAPRQWAAQSFYQDNPDTYDFIVVFTDFDFDTAGARAFYSSIRNDVQGIGLPEFDFAAMFGSNRLQGYVDATNLAGYLKEDGTLDQQDLTVTMNHEVAHRWLAHARFIDSSGNNSTALLGRDGSHWSYLLDSDASYLYGSKWKSGQNGTYTAIEVQQRYSALDLYLMGVLPADGVAPLTLLINPAIDPERLPVAGDVIDAQPSPVTIESIVAATGQRIPEASAAPREFRVAFIYLVDPATVPSAQDLQILDSMRSVFRQSFFQQTRGQALVSTIRGVPPVGGGAQVDLPAAASWLAGAQQAGGWWQDSPDTAIRETAESLNGLGPFGSAYDVNIDQGLSALPNLESASTELIARKAESILIHGGSAPGLIAELQSRGSGNSGWGAFPRYAGDSVSSALAVRALRQAGDTNTVEAGWAWLVSAQNADGGWGWRPGGASSLYPTLEVLLAAKLTLPGFWNRPEVQQAVSWLLPQQVAGGFGQPYPSTVETSLFLQIAEDSSIAPPVIQDALGFLAAHQDADGSWQGSSFKTALALGAVVPFGLPDPLVLSTEMYTEPESPYQDDQVTLHAAVINRGTYLPAGAPYRWELIDSQTQVARATFTGILPEIFPNNFFPLADTRPLPVPGGSYILRFSIDPDRTIPDRSRANNTASIPFTVKSRAAGIDLEPIGFASIPGVIISVPQVLTIHGTVLNHGFTDATAATVRVFDGPESGGAILGEQELTVPAGGSAPASVPIVVDQGKSYHLTINAEPANPADEEDDSNNTTSIEVPILQGEDMEITSLAATPASPVAGEAVTLTAQVRNSGTVPETGVQVGFTYSSGSPPSDFPIQLMTISETLQPGETKQLQVLWTPVAAGSDIEVKAVADPQGLLNDSDPSNNTATTLITVAPSTLPNLSVTPADISVTPPMPLQGQLAHIHGIAANLGSTPSGPFTLQLRLDDPAGPILGSVVVGGLDPGSSAAVDADWMVDQQQNRLVYLVADPENAVAEFNEQDNLAFSVIDVQTLADLVLTAGQIQWTPSFPQQGQLVQFSVTVLNTGDQNAENVLVELTDDSNAPLASQVIALVSAGSNAVAELSYTPDPAGELILRFRVNHAQSVPELSFANNEVSFVLPVQNGDAFVSDKFFSPNGDGIKDTTTLYFRAPADRVEVYAAEGALIRTITDLAGMSATWDGRTENGRVVPDGSYELRVGGGPPVWVEVDNNLVSISDHPRSRLIDATIPVNGFLHSYYVGPQEGSVFYVSELLDGTLKLYRNSAYETQVVGDWQSADERIIGCSTDASVCLAQDVFAFNFTVIRYPGAGRTPISPPFSLPHASLSPDGKWILWAVNSDAVALQSVDDPGLLYDVSPCHDPDFCEGFSTRYVHLFWDEGSTEALVVAKSHHDDTPFANVVWIHPGAAPTTTYHLIQLPVPASLSCYEGEVPLYASADFEKSEAYVTSDSFYGAYRLVDGSEVGTRNDLSECGDFGITSNNGAVIRSYQGLFDVRTGETIEIDPALRNVGSDWSPRDRSLFAGGESNGVTSAINYATIADNLLIALRPRVLFGNAGIELNVLVADRNLDRFTLEYADAASPGQFLPIGAPSREPIYGDLWGTWIPPHRGRYILRLSAFDLAGNIHSLTKAVTWNGDNDIANLYSETRYISPASSPGSKDNFVFGYYVLRPANLIFQILDAQDRVVRTLLVPAPQPGDATTVWDGKDESGNFVPDGKYNLEYLSARWPVTVDNTPPAASFVITGNDPVSHWDHAFPVNLYRNTLEATAEDQNQDRWTLFSRRFGTNDEWGAIQSETYQIRQPLPDRRRPSLPTDKPDGTGINWFVDKDFRFEVADLAGNTSTIQRFHREEQVSFADSEPPCRTDEDHPCVYPHRPQPEALLDYYGLLDFARATSSGEFLLAQPLLPDYNTLLIQESVWGFSPSTLRLEYRTHTPVGAWQQGTLNLALDVKERHLALAFLAPPVRDNVWMGYWDHPQLSPRDYEIRLVAVNQDGNEIASHNILYAPKGLLLEYLGTDLDGVRVRVTNQTQYVLRSIGVAAAGWKIPEIVFSESIPLLLPGESGEITSGCLLFSVLTGPHEVVLQAAGLDTSEIPTYSNVVPYTVLGVRTLLNADFEASRDCSNDPPPVGLNILSSGSIYSPGGQATLTAQMMEEPTGVTPLEMEIRMGGQVLATAPYSSFGWPTFNLDLGSFGEGQHPLKVTYRFPGGQTGLLNTCAPEFPVIINRTPPSTSILSPADGSVVCGQDSTGLCPLKNFVRVNSTWTGAKGILDVNGERVWDSDALCGQPPASIQMPEGFTVTYTGEYELTPVTFDDAGWYGCGTPIHITTVSGISVDANPELFSPLNTLGLPTTSVVQFTAGAPGAYILEIKNGNGTGVRSISGNASQGEIIVYEWDGRDADGALVPDGVYTVTATLTGACSATSSTEVEVDKTPPSVAVLRPVAGQEVGATLEAHGLAIDRNFLRYELQVRAAGGCETCWTTVDTQTDPREDQDDVLGVWDTGAYPAGEYEFRVWAVDEPGNQTFIEIPVSVYDRQLIRKFARTPDLISPANADGQSDQAEIRYGLLQNASVTLVIRDSAGADVVVFDAPGAYQPQDYVFTWDGRGQGGEPVPDDAYTVALQAVKPADPSVVESLELTIVVDNDPPVSDVTNIVEDLVYGLPLQLRAYVTDAHPRDYTIVLRLPDGTERLLRQGIALNEETVATLTNEVDGDYRITIHATDRASNSSDFQREFSLDSTVPAAQILAPHPGAFLNTQNHLVTLEGLVRAPHPDHYDWAYAPGDSPADPDFITILSSSPPAGDHTVDSWDASALPEGPFTLRLRTFDQLGRVREDRVTFTVDNTFPVVSIQSPAESATIAAPTAVSGLVSDLNLSGWKLEALPDGSSDPLQPTIAQGVDAINAELGLWDTLPPDGLYQLRLTATDRAENTAEALVQVRVEVLLPVPPVNLTAAIENTRDARLAWQPGPGIAPAGYNVYRDGMKINGAPVTATQYVDAELQNGLYSYTVRSVSTGSQESADSNTAIVNVDLNPPLAWISAPLSGQRIGGSVQITGTAYSELDFKEYRLSARLESGDWLLLAQRTTAVVDSVLGTWETAFTLDGSYELKLEAEDVDGNIGVGLVSVVVDNTPPEDSPLLLQAVKSAQDPDGEINDVNIQWSYDQAPPDFGGYFLYRNGQLANAAGPVIGSQLPYLIQATAYDDKNLPDGTYIYTVTASDSSGNESAESNPSDPVVIETRRPHAVIITPADGLTFTASVIVVADTPDIDIVSLQFEYKKTSDTGWSPFGAPLAHPPYAATFIAPEYGAYQIRAVAADAFGPDPSPESISVTHVPAVPALTARVNGADVTLTWPAVPDPYGTLQGYNIYRFDISGLHRINPSPVTELTYADSNLDEGGYDYRITSVDQGIESAQSEPVPAYVYRPTFDWLEPIRDSETADIPIDWMMSPGVAELQTENPDGSFATVSMTYVPFLPFQLEMQPLSPGMQSYRMIATDADGNISMPSELLTLVRSAPPAAVGSFVYTTGAGVVDLSWTAAPNPDSAGFRILRNGAVINETESPFAFDSASHEIASSDEADAELAVDGNPFTGWKPDTIPAFWQWTWPDEVEISEMDLTWATLPSPPERFDVDIHVSGKWIWLHSVLYNNSTTSNFPVGVKSTGVRIRARDYFNWHNATLMEIQLKHRTRTQGQSYSDSGLVPGAYNYSIMQLNRWGQVSPEMNVQALVDVPPPPAPVLSVTATGNCGELLLSWLQPDGFPGEITGYLLYRATSMEGPYQQIAGLGPDGLSYQDLVPVPSYYKIKAIGLISGVTVESAESAVAFGDPACPVPPEAPVITYPTTAGNPIAVQMPRVDIEGTAAPASIVRLFHNSVEVAQTTVDQPAVPVAIADYEGGDIAFSGNGRIAVYPVTTPGGSRIAIRDLETLQEQFLGDGVSYSGTPAISSDGEWVAYASNGNSADGGTDILLFNRATGMEARIDAAGSQWSPAFSGDGKLLAYISSDGTDTLVVVLDRALDTSAILYSQDQPDFPVFSPDAAKVLATTSTGLVVIDRATLQTQTVPGDWTYSYTATPFSPDGSAFLYNVTPGEPWTSTLWKFDLQQGTSTQISAAAGEMAGVFRTANVIDFLAVAADGSASIQERNLATSQQTPLYEGLQLNGLAAGGYISRFALSHTASGKLVAMQYQDLIALHPGGAMFRFPDVLLGFGSNTFVTRQDLSGTTLDSEPIDVEFSGAILPDAAAALAAFPPFPLSGESVLISGAVTNVGQTPLENCRVTLQRLCSNGLPQTVLDQLISLAPGESSAVRYDWNTGGVSGDCDWILRADPDGLILELTEANNIAHAAVPVRPARVVEADVTTDRPLYFPAQNVRIHVKVFSNRPPADYVVRTVVEDAAGYLVEAVEDRTLAHFGPGTVEYDLSWQITDIYPGDYRVQVTVTAAGSEVAADIAAFQLMPPMHITAQVSTAGTTYVAGDPVAVSGTVRNLGQATVQDLTTTFRVFSTAGDLIASEVRVIAALPPSGTAPLSWVWQSAGSAPGAYTIRLEVNSSFGVVVADAAPVTVTLTQPPVSLSGSVTLSSSQMEPGAQLECSASVTNTGMFQLQNLQIELTILNPSNLQVFASFSTTADLQPQQSMALNHSFATAGMPLGSYLVLLSASGDSEGPFAVTLSQAGFILLDTTPPEIHLIAPSSGLICDQALLQVQATDALSGVLEVSNSVDQGAQELPLQPLSIPDMYGAVWPVPVDQEGSHRFEIAAQDYYGNTSNTITVDVTADVNPPLVDTQAPDGECLSLPVQPFFSAADPHLSSVTATLNGAPFSSGTVVTADGSYLLAVTASDACSHASTEMRSFIIDTTPPLIAITGVADGEVYNTAVTPVWSIADANLISSQALLNGQPVEPGVTISETGSYTLSISASDCAQNAAQSVVQFEIAQHPPVAASQSLNVDEDAVLQITLHATDADGDSLTYRIEDGPAHGSLTGTPPDVVYTPEPDFHGPDAFTFVANDGHADSNPATVDITVGSVNDSPVADQQAVTGNEDATVAITLTGHDVDGDELSYAIVSAPQHGMLRGNPPQIDYVPDADFTGKDSLTFKASDGSADSNIATVEVRILPANDAPVAVNDSYTVSQGFTLYVRAPGVLGNDRDADGDSLTAILVTPPSRGFVVLNPDGSFRYTPNSSYVRNDSFTYKVSDGSLYSGSATVTLAVRDSARCPDPGAIDYGSYTGCEGSAYVDNQARLDAYEVDFGADGPTAQNLDVAFIPSGNTEVVSPCAIRLSGPPSAGAGLLCVYGRGGIHVASPIVNAGEVTLISDSGSIEVAGAGALLADVIRIYAFGGISIMEGAQVNAPELWMDAPGCFISPGASVISAVKAGSCFESDSAVEDR